MIHIRLPVASFSIFSARNGRRESGNGVFGGRFEEVPGLRFPGRDGRGIADEEDKEGRGAEGVESICIGTEVED